MVLKLTYFEARGLAELTRLLFKYGDIEFEDNRVARDKWPELKPTAPFGQMPMLENDGVVISQSAAIARFAARMVNLAGDNDWESAQIDAIVETLTDLRTKFFELLQEEDEERKVKLQETLALETLPYYLEKLEAIGEKNNGHLAVNKLTWADFYLVCMFDFLRRFKGEEIYSKYTNLKKIVSDVENIPNVKKWIETRPETEM